MLFENIERTLSQPLFSDFAHFTREVLSGSKLLNTESTIQLGLCCENLSQTFALAYRCALQTLLPQLNPQQWAAMCVTEESGNLPKDIQTVVNSDGTLTGHKSFVTMATLAQQLIVIAKNGEEQGRPILKAVLLDTHQTAINIDSLPSLNMLSDLPHGKVALNQAKGLQLPGDGYSEYSKHFRTLEDTFVLLAATAFILSQAWRNKMHISVVQQSLNIMSQVHALPISPSPWLNLQLAQSFEQFTQLVILFEKNLSSCTQAFSLKWQQDKKIFSLAQSARSIRAQKAMDEIQRLMALGSK